MDVVFEEDQLLAVQLSDSHPELRQLGLQGSFVEHRLLQRCESDCHDSFELFDLFNAFLDLDVLSGKDGVFHEKISSRK